MKDNTAKYMYDYRTGERIRMATSEEVTASDYEVRNGREEGVIEAHIDGEPRSCYVD